MSDDHRDLGRVGYAVFNAIGFNAAADHAGMCDTLTRLLPVSAGRSYARTLLDELGPRDAYNLDVETAWLADNLRLDAFVDQPETGLGDLWWMACRWAGIGPGDAEVQRWRLADVLRRLTAMGSDRSEGAYEISLTLRCRVDEPDAGDGPLRVQAPVSEVEAAAREAARVERAAILQALRDHGSHGKGDFLRVADWIERHPNRSLHCAPCDGPRLHSPSGGSWRCSDCGTVLDRAPAGS